MSVTRAQRIHSIARYACIAYPFRYPRMVILTPNDPRGDVFLSFGENEQIDGTKPFAAFLKLDSGYYVDIERARVAVEGRNANAGS